MGARREVAPCVGAGVRVPRRRLRSYETASQAGETAWVHGEGAPQWPRFSVTTTPESEGLRVVVEQDNAEGGLFGCAFDIALLGENEEELLVRVDLGPNGLARFEEDLGRRGLQGRSIPVGFVLIQQRYNCMGASRTGVPARRSEPEGLPEYKRMHSPMAPLRLR